MNRPEELSIVALSRDLPEFRLRKGDSGTVVMVYENDAVEVEFIDDDGNTVALLTITDDELDMVTGAELNSSRNPAPSAAHEEPLVADATPILRR